MTRRVALGSVLGIVGIALVFWPEFGACRAPAPGAGRDLHGARGAASPRSAAWSRTATRCTQLPLWQSLAWGMLYGALFSLAVALAARQAARLRAHGAPTCLSLALPRGARLHRRVRRIPHAAQAHRRRARGLHRRDGADRGAGDLGRVRVVPLACAHVARHRGLGRRQRRDPARQAGRRLRELGAVQLVVRIRPIACLAVVSILLHAAFFAVHEDQRAAGARGADQRTAPLNVVLAPAQTEPAPPRPRRRPRAPKPSPQPRRSVARASPPRRRRASQRARRTASRRPWSPRPPRRACRWWT